MKWMIIILEHMCIFLLFPGNADTLNLVDTALFCLALEDSDRSDPVHLTRLFLYGDAPSRSLTNLVHQYFVQKKNGFIDIIIWFIIHANDSRGSKAFSCVCVCVFLFVCLSVCPHDKTKTAETTFTKLAMWIVHHKSLPTK